MQGGNHTTISDEQDFGAVSARETIESDKERIARNRAIDSLRRAQTQPQLDSRSHSNDEDSDVYDDKADHAPGPLELLSQASDARALGDCMAVLSAPQRQSVALAFYDGLSHAEVAERMQHE